MEVGQMALDSRILGFALDRLEADRQKREREQQRLREYIYRRDGSIAELDRKLQETAALAVAAALSNGTDPVAAIERIGRENLTVQEQRSARLAALGFDPKCLDDAANCPFCSDSGFVGTRPCSCLMRYYKEEQRKELSKLLDLNGERFEAFNLEYYDDVRNSETGISPRLHMQMVMKACRQYAESFSANGQNLFLSGSPGLGKTFLSACIASTVSEKGYSVVYDTAVTICERFEEGHFGRRGNTEEAEADIRRYLSCDLLIMDDLGAEMNTSFSVSTIYEVINSRLRSAGSTVISSNLAPSELAKRYNVQIASRLNGEYECLRFYGRDIRKLKREE